MTNHRSDKPKTEAERQAELRAARLAEKLRANLQRRKAQLRSRREGAADESEGLPASENTVTTSD